VPLEVSLLQVRQARNQPDGDAPFSGAVTTRGFGTQRLPQKSLLVIKFISVRVRTLRLSQFEDFFIRFNLVEMVEMVDLNIKEKGTALHGALDRFCVCV